ncbi:MAG: S-methyl-5-thioribose-1-phosphate isomerase [Planctomycetes bacterium]|nr:S-methyl-5-thioribose-1-phosphate isomerase [Planctomycetota bacterium]
MAATSTPVAPLVPAHPESGEPVRALVWDGGVEGVLRYLDQTLLPHEALERLATSANDVHAAIHRLAIRGAPAIGIAGAYGLVLGARPHVQASPSEFLLRLDEVAEHLIRCRPTAVNLAHAIRAGVARARAAAQNGARSPRLLAELLVAAQQLHADDERCCAAMGRIGAELVRDGDAILTHCNAGALATGGTGTALAAVYAARAAGKRVQVYADETRPLLQGARLTAWELSRAGIPVTLLVDGASASLLRTGLVAAVFVGADRIAANGDVANKIGTLAVALAAREFGVPFYVVAPTSTIDLATRSGEAIPIEMRDGVEIASARGVPLAASGASHWNPAFDVTPARLVTALITERGLVRAPDEAALRAHLS